jgi:hypothetical protein
MLTLGGTAREHERTTRQRWLTPPHRAAAHVRSDSNTTSIAEWSLSRCSGFHELQEGGWGNRYFDEAAQTYALEHLGESDAFLCGRVTYEVFKEFWPQVKEREYATP